MISTAPYNVSSDFGQLHVIRHLSSGIDCAIAGLATAVAARPMPAACRNFRRFISCTLPLCTWRDEPRIPFGRRRTASSRIPRAGPSQFAPVQPDLESAGRLKMRAGCSPGPPSTLSGRSLAAYSRADHKGIIGVLGDLPPQILVVTEGNDRIPNLLVVGIGGRCFGVHLFGRLQAGLHHRCRERPKLGARRNQAFKRLRILGVIVGQLPRAAGACRGFKDGLIAFWQLVPFRKVDEDVVGGAALPPARIVVVLHDLVEPELFVVIGPYPFSSIDRALFQRRIDVTPGDLLRDNTELAKSFTSPAPDAHLEPL